MKGGDGVDIVACLIKKMGDVLRCERLSFGEDVEV